MKKLKVDVCINVFGKPWQTLCTLKSLMKFSGYLIDKIFLIKEKKQPFNDSVDWLEDHFTNLIIHVPKNYIFFHSHQDYSNEDYRKDIRYQFGFENSDKEFLFITHNDVLYTGDIISEMLDKIGDAVGIGEIGQCWNCPANSKGLCSGENFYNWNPTYDEVISMLPHVRTHKDIIDKQNPKPLPECRLNEWCCLVNRKMSNSETFPNGNTPPFGSAILDIGTMWFRSMVLKGYNFIDYRKNYIHSYWSELNNGFQTQQYENLYWSSEQNAKIYFKNNFNL